MTIKKILLSTAAIIICGNAIAQDKIYKHNGDIIDGKVTEINGRNISYKRADNTDGPTYIIEKNAVDKIEYQNGSEEVITENRRMGMDRPVKHDKTKYGNNIFTLAPLQVTSDGLGIGLGYERILDKRGIISFSLPLAWSFLNDNNNGPGYNGSYYGNRTTTNVFYAMPGLKIYPAGSKGKVRYAIGPSIALATGTEKYDNDIYDPTFGYYKTTSITRDIFRLGVMINNSLNINPTAHLTLGIDMGMGVTYIYQIDGRDQGEDFLGQFAFRIGYRF